MDSPPVTLRAATRADLDAVNAVVEAAVLAWNLPERVKRLSLPVYRYDAADFEALHLLAAVAPSGDVLGVAAWEPIESPVADGGPGVLLHGLYVDPQWQGRGIGSRLLGAVLEAARDLGATGVLVRAQREAEGFFRRHGFFVLDADESHPRRWWRPTQAA